MESLTPKQQKFFEFIKKFIQQRGYAPTLQDMAAHFKLSSLGTVQQYLQALEDKGYIERSNKARGLSLAPSADERSEVQSLPVLGKIAAGRPLEHKKNGEVRPVPSWMLRRQGEHFLLQVQGDSMMNEGILDGDFVLVHRQQEASSGEIVVAMLGEDATLKKLVKKKQKIELHSANPRYEPIIVTDEIDFHIEGIYCGLIRSP